MKITVTGSQGRMGQAVQAAIQEHTECQLQHTHDQGQELAERLQGSQGVIDFTLPPFSAPLVDECVKFKLPIVMGTTGHNSDQLQHIKQASQHIAIVHAPNFSVGVNTLFWLAQHATRILGEDFDLEILEMHHRHKIDSPSGTAVRLAQVIAKARGLDYPNQAVFGREGETGPRPTDEIAVHTLRGGDVVGDHTAIYAAEGERIELTHKASSRATFARGAVRAALWAQNQQPGLYDMQDVLGLK